MCGRYVLALRYSDVRDVLNQQGLFVDDYPDRYREVCQDKRQRKNDDQEYDQVQVPTDERHTAEQTNGDEMYRPTYNLAPGHLGIVLRPVFRGEKKEIDPLQAGLSGQPKNRAGMLSQHRYQLQVMQWGLVSSWSRTKQVYTTKPKAINCRADSLASGGSPWASLRGRKRCVVVANGFYEWRKAGPRDRVPHYIRRRDGLPLLMAGLWDELKDENGETKFSFVIITTDSNAGLQFLHDRMPVLLDYRSVELQAWLDVENDSWSTHLQSLLRPWPHTVDDKNDGAALLVDIVSKEVNKVGNSSASMVVPVASADNKSNIANFFQGSAVKRKAEKEEPDIGNELLDEIKLFSTPLSPAKVAFTGLPMRPDNAASAKVAHPAPTMKKTKTISKSDAEGKSSQKITSFFSRNA